jgi:PleD family two-component response regulator
MEKKYRILIVDDDLSIRSLYSDIFKSEGFEVIEAVDGVDGLDKATKELPDIIFTGIIMPRMDGFGLMEALRKNVATVKIPIVVSSHMGREDDKKRALELGADDFFVWGMITPKEVVVHIISLLEGKEYKLKLNGSELDIYRLIDDLGYGRHFSCPECGEELVLKLKFLNAAKNEFRAKIECPKCGEILN